MLIQPSRITGGWARQTRVMVSHAISLALRSGPARELQKTRAWSVQLRSVSISTASKCSEEVVIDLGGQGPVGDQVGVQGAVVELMTVKKLEPFNFR